MSGPRRTRSGESAGPTGWEAEEHAPARRAQLLELFGTATLPLPFGASTERGVVVESLRPLVECGAVLR